MSSIGGSLWCSPSQLAEGNGARINAILPKLYAIATAMKFQIDGPGLILTLLATGAVNAAVLFSAVESYVPFYPTIDTILPPEFSEAKFRQVQRGTDKETVLALLGNPNGVRRRDEGSNVWVYGSDGACSWWDFAWIEYQITFDGDDKVSAATRQVYYD